MLMLPLVVVSRRGMKFRAYFGTGRLESIKTDLITGRYWDCCKPSCAWPGKASVSNPVLTCDANDNPITNADTKSGCDGGSSYTCASNSPWAISDALSYGFAATSINGGNEASWCCACYA